MTDECHMRHAEQAEADGREQLDIERRRAAYPDAAAYADATRPRIAKTPGVCGGDARVSGTRLAVWGLEEWRRLGWDDARILTAYPSLTAADLAAAWRYADENPEEIGEAIRENQAVEGGR